MSFSRVIDKISQALFSVAMIGTFLILVVVTANVFARYIFNAPFHWAEEVTAITLILVTLFPAAEILKKGMHIKFELIKQKLPENIWAFLEVLINLLSMVFTSVLTWQTFMATRLVYLRNMKEPSLLGTPMWVPYGFMLIGIAVLFLMFLIAFFVSLRKLAGR